MSMKLVKIELKQFKKVRRLSYSEL